MDRVAAYVQQQETRYNTGKIVVYYPTQPQTIRLAEILGCRAYNSQVNNKAKTVMRFREGQERTIVCTSAFGMGVDISDTRTVVHIDKPQLLLDYAQESGRAGRDGHASEAVIVMELTARVEEQPPWARKGEVIDVSTRQLV